MKHFPPLPESLETLARLALDVTDASPKDLGNELWNIWIAYPSSVEACRGWLTHVLAEPAQRLGFEE